MLSSTIDHSGIDLRILVLGQANLNVEIEGNGEVNSNPSGIDCGTACSVGFVNNIEVQLTAQASEGNIFTHWDQACASESTVICTIDMNSDQSVTAHFSVDYDNDGIVDSEDSSVDLDKGLSILGNSIPIGNGQAEVSATNATDFGDLQVDSVTTQNFVIENKSNRDVTVTNINIRSLLQSRSTLNRNRDLTVANINIRSLLQSRSILNREGSGDDFSILTTFPFVITKGGSAEINVEFMPTTPGLQERTIVVFFDTGTEINFRIAGTGKQATPVTTESTLTVAINGQGHISSNPLGIDCGTTCSADFANNLNVQIIAQASEGNSFTHWNQACSSESTTTCTLDMSSAHSATAYFAIDYDNDGVVDSEDSSVDEDKGLSILGNNVPIENGQAEVGATDATDFGDLQLDFVTTQSFVIENKSNRDVTVTSINIRSLFQRRSTQKRADSVDDFSILTSFPFVITAGGSAEIEVEFIPTTQGLQERTVVVGFDTGTKINFRVAGNAVQAAPIAIASQNIPAIEPIGLIILLLSLFFLGYRRNN